MNDSKCIVGILGFSGEGGTFIDWSLHYLTGRTEHHQILINRNKLIIDDKLLLNRIVCTLCNNPLSTIGNAHEHRKTHPTLTTTPDVISEFEKLESGLHTFYTSPSRQDYHFLREEDKNVGALEIIDSNYNVLNETYKNIKFIRVILDKNSGLEYSERYITNFLRVPDSANKLTFLVSLKTMPDKRNYILDAVHKFCQGRVRNWSKKLFTEYDNQYILTFSDVFYNLEDKIKDIICWTGQRVDSDRLEKWQLIYAEWQRVNGVDFYRDIDLIVNNIISGSAFDLSNYNLSAGREAALIYKLKQRGIRINHTSIECMPLDTCDWHNLIIAGV